MMGDWADPRENRGGFFAFLACPELAYPTSSVVLPLVVEGRRNRINWSSKQVVDVVQFPQVVDLTTMYRSIVLNGQVT